MREMYNALRLHGFLDDLTSQEFSQNNPQMKPA